MSDIQKVYQINLDYNGKHYCLEYTPDTIVQMETAGFSIGDIGDKPMSRIKQLWSGAFMAHHRKDLSSGIAEELYRKIGDKDGLIQKLAEMYNGTLAYLTDEDDEGNVEWTATF